jgi:RND family efflux transporter MFP subunit
MTSDKVIQRTETEYQSLKAQYEGARHQLIACGMTTKDLETLLDEPESFEPYLILRAPISGIVAQRNASRGDRVQISDELFVIVDNSVVTIQGNVFQENLNELKPDLHATFTSKAFPGVQFSGVLSSIGAAFDENSHTLPVWCTVQNKDASLKPHLQGELQIETGVLQSVNSIPSNALVFDGNDTYVFRDIGNGSLEYVMVQTGQSFADRIEINAGLNPGDRIASSGVFMLKSRYKLSQMQEE